MSSPAPLDGSSEGNAEYESPLDKWDRWARKQARRFADSRIGGATLGVVFAPPRKRILSTLIFLGVVLPIIALIWLYQNLL